jgi:hypothetical protein
LTYKEEAQYPTTAQLSEYFTQINPFRHKKGRKPTKNKAKIQMWENKDALKRYKYRTG